MKIAYVLYNELTLLDFVGFYDPVARLKSLDFLPDLSWDLCALTPAVTDNFGLEIRVDVVRPDLGAYDLIYVPGGFGSRRLTNDTEFLAWLGTAAPVPLKVSVCTGSLLLGAAGFLGGKRATTHFNEYEALRPYAGTVLTQEIVEDGDVITGGAVAASLELGLYLCKKLAGEAAAEAIRNGMNYRNKVTSPVSSRSPSPKSSR